jgi:cobalt-zinc-cadmium efflux system protein
MAILMQFSPPHIDLDAIEKRLCGLPGVISIFHVHIWQLTDHQIHFEANILFSPEVTLREAIDHISEIKQILAREFKISHTMLEPSSAIGDQGCW